MSFLLSKSFIQQALQIAGKAAESSGKIILDQYHKENSVRQKNHEIQDFVSAADLSSEDNIKKIIGRFYPKHNLLGEETGYHEFGKSDFTWVFDPLCGTANFINHIPLFVVSIGLLYKNNPVLGVIYLPIDRELYTASLNQGAFVNQRQIKISKVNSLSRAMLAFDLGKTKENRALTSKIAGRLITSAYKLREFGSTPLSCVLLASGRIDGYLGMVDPWDAVASAVIVKEAGGYVSDWKGNPWRVKSKSFVASNGKIHNQLIHLLI
ncbi:MAG TPA: inositol monophosphatase family protein [Candidatus Bathyarchaeia archaeon]|nr:inositol monophosphatase family protein [Candidatus Bathyarchaeia archaeon]